MSRSGSPLRLHLLALAGLAGLPAVIPALTPAACAQASAQPAGGAAASDQVIVPQVERRDVAVPKVPSNDFAFSLFGGSWSTQNFGSSGVVGARLGYHITEDVFVEASYGRTKVSDSTFRQVLPGGIFTLPSEQLTYEDVVAGYNLLPGEVFFGRGRARAIQGYVVAGVGSTKFVDQSRQTLVFGFGLRLIVTDHFALQADVRDHSFSLDLLGQRQSTQNPEVTFAVTGFF